MMKTFIVGQWQFFSPETSEDYLKPHQGFEKPIFVFRLCFVADGRQMGDNLFPCTVSYTCKMSELVSMNTKHFLLDNGK
jgi:hypothetical protein